jgi:hypothetical protein
MSQQRMEAAQFSWMDDIRLAAARVIIFLGANALFAISPGGQLWQADISGGFTIGQGHGPQAPFFYKGRW